MTIKTLIIDLKISYSHKISLIIIFFLSKSLKTKFLLNITTKLKKFPTSIIIEKFKTQECKILFFLLILHNKL